MAKTIIANIVKIVSFVGAVLAIMYASALFGGGVGMGMAYAYEPEANKKLIDTVVLEYYDETNLLDKFGMYLMVKGIEATWK